METNGCLTFRLEVSGRIAQLRLKSHGFVLVRRGGRVDLVTVMVSRLELSRPDRCHGVRLAVFKFVALQRMRMQVLRHFQVDCFVVVVFFLILRLRQARVAIALILLICIFFVAWTRGVTILELKVDVRFEFGEFTAPLLRLLRLAYILLVRLAIDFVDFLVLQKGPTGISVEGASCRPARCRSASDLIWLDTGTPAMNSLREVLR